MERMTVNGHEYEVLKLLGKGKGGYSYLVRDPEAPDARFVLKQIHHEPCAYYTFGDKFQSELNDYERLRVSGIRVPRLLDGDRAQERLLKEYIDGPTAAALAEEGGVGPELLEEVRAMAAQAKAAGLNIDYYPTNFIASTKGLFYIDYECNAYMPEWDLEHWGLKYWLNGVEAQE